MKIVINKRYGGFGLSKMALEAYASRKGINPGEWDDRYNYFKDLYEHEITRNDADLIAVVESLGPLANGHAAELKIVEIPDGINWGIHSYDGMEHIYEEHRTWE
jgi:hypothetical protein